MNTSIGVSYQRKEAWDKVSGAAKYTADTIVPGMSHAKMVTSNHAHAKIISIDTTEALKIPGVQAVITGNDYPILCGTVIEDRPPLARGKVRYYGEPVALVVAASEHEAAKAAQAVKVAYQPLPIVHSPRQALEDNAPLVHENLAQYKLAVENAQPQANTNIADKIQIRKGDMAKGWVESECIVEASFILPKSDHVAMETRAARAQILPDGRIMIYSSSQAPYSVKKLISQYFNIEEGNVIVKTPLVGGAFGGKAAVQLEILAYIASRAINGKTVKIANTREEDMISSPCRIGVEANVKLGATKDGMLKAVEITYLVDTGAYTDTGPRMAKAMAVDCTGPYHIENVWCDSLCVYTNHPYATSFRGFGHLGATFCMERTLDKLAFALQMDPFELRLKNALTPGLYSPTQVKLTSSNLGNLIACLNKLKPLINWDEGMRVEIGENKVRAKGLSCFWKTSDSPTNAISGVLLSFNGDGSININSGAVEIGPAMKTTLAQILAERLKMDIKRVHVNIEVDTMMNPEHWKTVASMTTYMAGRAVIRATDDIIAQLKSIAAIAMRCPPEDLEVAEEKVFLRQDPSIYIHFKDVVHGFKYLNGNSIEGQLMSRGSFIMSHITGLDQETGKGKPGPGWAVGAQAVEVEFDTKEYTYRLIKAVTVVDAGKVINPKTARGLITGGMCMGLGVGTREAFTINDQGVVENTSLRTYKMMHYGQTPDYIVEFVETPQVDAPYGARGIAEHGILGIPSALANALSSAAQVDLNYLPLTPEAIWTSKTGGNV